MRTGLGLVVVFLAASLVAVVLVGGDPDGAVERADRLPDPTTPEEPRATPAGIAPRASSELPGGARLILMQPDLPLPDTSTLDSEAPPRTVAGLPAVKRSVDLPVVDPKSLPYDPKAGHVDVAEPNAIPDSGLMPGPQLVVDNDGPLGGLRPQPDPSVPGPGGISGDNLDDVRAPTGTTSEAGTQPSLTEGPVHDSHGPGQRIDPALAKDVLPNFRLPDDNDVIEDPDLSYRPEDPQ